MIGVRFAVRFPAVRRLLTGERARDLASGWQERFPAFVAWICDGLHEQRIDFGFHREVEQLHACLLGRASSFAAVTANAAADDIFPGGLSAV